MQLFGADGAARRAQASTLSYTSLRELERCGYRYYLERVLGMREDRARRARASPAGGRSRRGRAGRSCTCCSSASIPLAAARPRRSRWRVRARELGIAHDGEQREEIAQPDRRGARGRAAAARLAAAVRLRREYPFAFALDAGGPGGPLINGVIDLLADEADGGALVIDYKSDRVGPADDLDALVERDYSVQRLLYALAVLRDGAPRGGDRPLVPRTPRGAGRGQLHGAPIATSWKRCSRRASAARAHAGSRSARTPIAVSARPAQDGRRCARGARLRRCARHRRLSGPTSAPEAKNL